MSHNLYNDIKYGKRRLIRPFDIVFIAALIAVIALSYFFTANESGSSAEIYSGGTLIKTMPLNTDAEYRYEYGNGYNIITVKDGRISVTEASCNDKICMQYPPVDTAGGVTICLPHRLFIVIKGSGGVDGVAG